MALQAAEILLRDEKWGSRLREYSQWLTETFMLSRRDIFLSNVIGKVTFQLLASPITDDMVQMLEDIAADGWRR